MQVETWHLHIEHGWSALQFHERCNMNGPCVIYAVTTTGARFGGFNSEGFKSSDDYSPSSKAFLFCWPQSEEDPVILRKARHVFKLTTIHLSHLLCSKSDCPETGFAAEPIVLRPCSTLWAQTVFTASVECFQDASRLLSATAPLAMHAMSNTCL